MDKNATEKLRLGAMGIITVLVLLSVFAYGGLSVKAGNIIGGWLSLAIAIVLTIFAVKLLRAEREKVSKGFPMEDERSVRIKTKAAAYSFYVSIYLLLAISWYDNLSTGWRFRDVSQAMGAAILGMAILFGVFWAYFNRKGDVK